MTPLDAPRTRILPRLVSQLVVGGTLAFHIAVRSPESIRGCLLLDAAVPFELAARSALQLAEIDLRVALVADPRSRPPGVPEDVSAPEYLARTFRQLNEGGFEVTLGTLGEEGVASLRARLVEGARFLVSAETTR